MHAFGTAGTGGFGIRADSLASYSPYLQWVVAVFMLLFGVNFNVYQLVLLRRFRSAFGSSELWCYFAIVGVSVTAITLNLLPVYHSLSEALRASVFQVASITTTTGYSTANFDLWPGLSKTILVLLMVIGACAGSTAGGLKVSRVMLLFKAMRRDLRRLLHPRSVGTVKLEGRRVDEQTLADTSSYFVLYMLCVAVVFVLLSFEPFNLETNLTATLACFNNIGPGLGAVGPAASFAGYSGFSKCVLSGAMLLGRLEIYPLLVALTPSTWIKKHG